MAGLAITQPLLDLMGRNPEFFVAGRYTGAQIVAFAVVVAVLPSAALLAVFAVARLVHRRAGDVVHALVVAGLGALLGNVVVRAVGDTPIAVALAAGAAGAGATVLVSRTRPGRLLLCYLAIANVVFPGAFLLASPASALLSQDPRPDAIGEVSVPVPPGPVVVIVFDELPVSTLMRADGGINDERYPSFARLAAGSTWFRNASSPHSHTERALPAIATGMVRDERVLPTFTALPRNLLALLGTTVPVERYEAVTDLCPRSVCAAQASQPLRQALEDSLVVFGHRVLPGALRDDLSRIDEAWGSFGSELDDGPAGVRLQPDNAGGDALARWHGTDRAERSSSTQVARLVEHGTAVGADSALHFIHVVTPHSPWFDTPWGTRLMRPMPAWHHEDRGPLGRWSELVLYQRHSLQTGAADVALGRVLDHLDEGGLWDDATILVTADHGTSLIAPGVGREPDGSNEEELLRVPLFLKVPGQAHAAVVDDVAMTIDILPTLIDVLDIETSWELDGHSLLDGSAPTVSPSVSTDVEELFEVIAYHEAQFRHGWDWTALAAVGEHGGLVGRALTEVEMGEPSSLSWYPNNGEAFAEVPTRAGDAPQLVTGRVYGSGDVPPSSLVLVVNGTIAGVTGGYEHRDDGGWAFSSVLGPYLQPADNQIRAYEVAGVPDRPTLHQLQDL